MEIYEATISEITEKATISSLNKDNNALSTNSILKKGDRDIYGNIIEYDIEDWIGEDYEIQNDTEKILENNIFNNNSYVENYGKLNIYLSDITTFIKTNIDITLVDDGYSLHTIHLFYRNNYKEKIDIMAGRYRIYDIRIVGSEDNTLLYTKEKEFIIEDQKTYDLEILHKAIKTNASKETIESLSINTKEVDNDKIFKNSFTMILLSVLLFIVFGIVALFLLKKYKNKE